MSKKTITDYKAGRHFRCEVCNKPCTDDIFITKTITKDIYMGRVDKTKQTVTYFCSDKCGQTTYIQRTVVNVTLRVADLKIYINRIKSVYKNEMQQDPTGDFKVWILYLKMMRDIQLFYQAILDKKSEYELYELKLKALHTDALALEEFHEEEDCMNLILRMRTAIETLDIHILGNR